MSQIHAAIIMLDIVPEYILNNHELSSYDTSDEWITSRVKKAKERRILKEPNTGLFIHGCQSRTGTVS